MDGNEIRVHTEKVVWSFEDPKMNIKMPGKYLFGRKFCGLLCINLFFHAHSKGMAPAEWNLFCIM